MKDKNKKILILGAGEAQFNLIKCAKELGYFVVVCDMRPEMEGSKLADKYYQVNYMERDAIYKVAVEEKIDGVISNSEVAMINVSYLVDKLGLPGNSMTSVKKLLSKENFRNLQKKCGVFYPQSFVVETQKDIYDVARKLKYPILVKPVESSGTRGVTKIENYSEQNLLGAFEICKKYSRNDLVALEEYVEMPKLEVFQADIFVAGEEFLWDGLFTTKRVGRMPFVPMTHMFPVDSNEEDINLLKECVEKIVRKAGIKLGELNVEAYITKDHEIFVIEINARQGGNHIPELIKAHTGVDLTKLLVTMTVGDSHYFEALKKDIREDNLIMLHMVFPNKAGLYKNLYIDEKIQKYITSIEELYVDGDAIEKNDNAEDVLAYIRMKFNNRNEQIYFSDKMEEYIYANIE